MTIQSKVNIDNDVFLQEVDDETIILNAKTQEYFSLDEMGSIFYHFLKEEDDLEIIVKELSEHFSKDEKVIENDLLQFLKSLEEKGLVKVT